jgi:hypothetical protein
MHQRECRYRYTFEDAAFQRAGIVLCVGPASQPPDLLLALQPLLRFQTFALRLPTHAADGSRAGAHSWPDDIAEVLCAICALQACPY